MEKTDNWAAFGSKYLKALDVLNDTDEYAIVNVTSQEETRNNVTKEVLHLHLERDGAEKLFGCNATNANTVQEAFPKSPKDAIGSTCTFTKEKVQNPATKQVVDGLRIVFKHVESVEPSEADTDEAGIAEDSTM